MKCTELPHPSKGSLGGAPGQLNKPCIEIYFVFSDSDDEMHGRSLPGFYKSIRSCLRNDHWYQKLVWSCREWHLVTRITFGKLRPTSHWCFLCPDKSMAPVLAITDMVARARRDDSLL